MAIGEPDIEFEDSSVRVVRRKRVVKETLALSRLGGMHALPRRAKLKSKSRRKA
jgi:hypothetical protein